MFNLKLSIRGLLRSPGFALAAVTTLALGIGLNAAMLAVFDRLFLRPLPFHDLDSLVAVYDADPKSGWTTNALNGANFIEYRQRSASFEAMAAYQDGSFTLSGDGEPERIYATKVGCQFFPLLRIRPCLGRLFLPEEDEPDGPNVVLIDHALWMDRFSGDPSILGRTIRLNGQAHEIVGVLPAGLKFGGLLDGRVFLPLRLGPLEANSRTGHSYFAFGRLRKGRSAADADRELKVVAGQLAAEFPATSAPGTGSGSATVLPLLDVVRSDNSTSAVTLLCLSVFLLLIACANVANLILARGLARQHELAICSAMGASRGVLVCRILTESAILGLASCLAGLAIGKTLLLGIRMLLPDLPQIEATGLDGWTLAYLLGSAAMAIALSGLVPAWSLSHIEPMEAIKKRQKGLSGPRQRRFQSALLAAQIGLSMVLLTGAGLMLRTLWKLDQVEPGIRPDGLLTGMFTLPGTRYVDSDAAYAFVRRVRDRMAALPGVRSASVANVAPVVGWPSNTRMGILGRPELPGSQNVTFTNVVTPEYFKTAGVPLLQGEVPPKPAPDECLVNERFVKIHGLGADGLGKQILGNGPNGAKFLLKIVGVAGNVRFLGLVREHVPQCYTFPVQGSKITHRSASENFCIYLKCEGNPSMQAGPMKAALRELDPDLALYNIRRVDEIIRVSLRNSRTTTTLFIFFGSLGLLLAAMGLHGLISYLVAQRTRDIGIRISLGAEKGRIMTEVLRNGLVSTGMGLCLGTLVSLAMGRFMASQLFRVSPGDPLALGAGALLLCVVSLSAALIPALRAVRIEPVVALREE